MLYFDRSDLRAYAEAEGIRWIEDPSNQDKRFDRNFLRHEILPRLKTRWPDIASRLQRSASHASEATSLLIDIANIDLDALGGRTDRLPIPELLDLPRYRQKNLIRHALRVCGLTVPTALQLDTILDELLPARRDAQPQVRWPGGSVRRYRDYLYLLPDELADALPTGPIAGSRIALGEEFGAGQCHVCDSCETTVSYANVRVEKNFVVSDKTEGPEGSDCLEKSFTKTVKMFRIQ